MKPVDCEDLVDALAELIDKYMEDNPDFTADEAHAALSYVEGSIFRLASDIPASKLH